MCPHNGKTSGYATTAAASIYIYCLPSSSLMVDGAGGKCSFHLLAADKKIISLTQRFIMGSRSTCEEFCVNIYLRDFCPY